LSWSVDQIGGPRVDDYRPAHLGLEDERTLLGGLLPSCGFRLRRWMIAAWHVAAAVGNGARVGRARAADTGGPRDQVLTNVLPCGPARTALCSALPRAHCFQDKNHIVQPLSRTPARGLPVIFTGSPGTAIM